MPRVVSCKLDQVLAAPTEGLQASGSMSGMLHLDLRNLSKDRLGEKQGLDFSRELDAYSTQLEAAKEALFGRKKDPKNMLGWVDLPEDTEQVRELLRFKDAQSWVQDFVVLGIGGSALGAQCLAAALGGSGVRLHFVDNVEPGPVIELLAKLNPAETLVNVISKSGNTPETMAAFLVFGSWLERRLGPDWKRHLVVTTDPEKGLLRSYARREQVSCFAVPESVGGRFSVFSAAGLLPLAFAGVGLEALLSGARKANQTAQLTLAQNLPAQTALVHHLYAARGVNINVLMPYSSRLKLLPSWFVQLHAESLGKAKDREGREVFVGTTPIPAVGATDQHAQVQLFREGPFDKLVAFIQIEKPAQDLEIPRVAGLEALDYLFGKSFHRLLSSEASATAHALAKAGRPNYAMVLEKLDEYHLGWLLQHLMWQTAFLGELWNINAFNQPGVELGKEYTYALMGRKGYEELRETLIHEGAEGHE